MNDSEQLEALVQNVLDSPKYRLLCPELVRRVGNHELVQNRRRYKEAVKETKNTLHQATGAYLEQRPSYAKWREELNAASMAGEEAVQDTCMRFMQSHASTRERLPFLSDFFSETLSGLPDIKTVLDLACGLNPLARPWMPFSPETHYLACDLYGDMMQFLEESFRALGMAGAAQTRDLLSHPCEDEVDLALILKTLPLLEQQKKGTSAALLRNLKARFILVSFPTRSLGGRGKGMAENYEAQFRAMVAGERWDVQRFEFPNELCFRISRD